MTYTEYQQYMKNFFEKYYQKLSQQDELLITLPLAEDTKEMWSDDADPTEEWKKWKLVPATIKDEEIEDLENEIGVILPLSLRAFLTVYHHFFDDPVGRNPVSEHFEGIMNAWNPILVKFGYLPFTWDKDNYYIRCIKLEEIPDEEKCGLYQIDHELLFDFDEDTVTQEEIDENMQHISENLLTYLDEILNDKDYDSQQNEKETEAAKAIIKVLKDELGIMDFESFNEKFGDDPDSIYEALEPVQEQYSLTEDYIDYILEYRIEQFFILF